MFRFDLHFLLWACYVSQEDYFSAAASLLQQRFVTPPQLAGNVGGHTTRCAYPDRAGGGGAANRSGSSTWNIFFVGKDPARHVEHAEKADNELRSSKYKYMFFKRTLAVRRWKKPASSTNRRDSTIVGGFPCCCHAMLFRPMGTLQWNICLPLSFMENRSLDTRFMEN